MHIGRVQTVHPERRPQSLLMRHRGRSGGWNGSTKSHGEEGICTYHSNGAVRTTLENGVTRPQGPEILQQAIGRQEAVECRHHRWRQLRWREWDQVFSFQHRQPPPGTQNRTPWQHQICRIMEEGRSCKKARGSSYEGWAVLFSKLPQSRAQSGNGASPRQAMCTCSAYAKHASCRRLTRVEKNPDVTIRPLLRIAKCFVGGLSGPAFAQL